MFQNLQLATSRIWNQSTNQFSFLSSIISLQFPNLLIYKTSIHHQGWLEEGWLEGEGRRVAEGRGGREGKMNRGREGGLVFVGLLGFSFNWFQISLPPSIHPSLHHALIKTCSWYDTYFSLVVIFCQHAKKSNLGTTTTTITITITTTTVWDIRNFRNTGCCCCCCCCS